MGPWVVTPDELADPDDLALGCSVDGETMQEARTSDLIFGVPRLVAELSAVLPLLPGDVIFTGTPAGVGGSRDPTRFLPPGRGARVLDRGHRHHPEHVSVTRTSEGALGLRLLAPLTAPAGDVGATPSVVRRSTPVRPEVPVRAEVVRSSRA